MKMNILFVGSVVSMDVSNKYVGISIAANKMQIGVIQALSELADFKIDTISIYPLAAFPKEKKIWMGSQIMKLSNNNTAKIVPFINIFLFKQIFQMWGLLFEILKWSYKNRNEKKIIICYNAFTEWSFPTILVSKISKIPAICLLADLPINVIKHGPIKMLARMMQIKSTEYFIKKFDGLIVLNKEAPKKYSPNSPFCIIDGGIDVNDYTPPKIFGGQLNCLRDDDNIFILFAGALIRYNGIINLIEAINHITFKKVFFYFYGDGPLKEFIINASKDDNRIVYKGNVSNIEILELQKKSSFLINPRISDDPVSQVTFPSKIIEYMMSGTPVLTTRLNGLMPNYNNFLSYIRDNPIEMAEDIESILKTDKDILISKAKLAYEFVLKNKNWNTHANTILQFLKRFN